MVKLAVLSTDKDLNQRITHYCKALSKEFVPIFLEDQEKGLEYLNYELPEISIFNISDKNIPIVEVLKAVKADPWLHYGGIIGIHRYRYEQEEELEKKLRDTNIVAFIPRRDLDFSFPRLIRILNQNRQILFQRDIQNTLLTNVSGSYVIENDPFDIKTYSYLVSNYLFNTNYVNRETREGLLVALMELLMNAIEHGNCRITYQQKSEWLDSGKNIFQLIRMKNQDSEIKGRMVYFRYRFTPRKSTFTIRDEGDGFDWKKRITKITEKSAMKLHGRGIIMADHYVKDLSYNEKGNEVTFDIEHQTNETNILPKAFSTEQEVIFEDDDTIFTEGEESTFLYYIVSGALAIIANKKILTTLTPDDLFLGEMSFLLNNRRSATVRSVGRSVLIKISKEAFVNVIRQKPHYGIFLARILAQRLNRLNRLI